MDEVLVGVIILVVVGYIFSKMKAGEQSAHFDDLKKEYQFITQKILVKNM